MSVVHRDREPTDRQVEYLETLWRRAQPYIPAERRDRLEPQALNEYDRGTRQQAAEDIEWLLDVIQRGAL